MKSPVKNPEKYIWTKMNKIEKIQIKVENKSVKMQNKLFLKNK